MVGAVGLQLGSVLGGFPLLGPASWAGAGPAPLSALPSWAQEPRAFPCGCREPCVCGPSDACGPSAPSGKRPPTPGPIDVRRQRRRRRQKVGESVPLAERGSCFQVRLFGDSGSSAGEDAAARSHPRLQSESTRNQTETRGLGAGVHATRAFPRVGSPDRKKRR
ncbi:unnamed protein product [Rangifer tarandus platyrhynchus]|uniref:Uncharacterized protein n=1 Tax=Rangifer tarandus platyrhynchus TaxID=3082113 RepID=A0AC59Y038_RANTA